MIGLLLSSCKRNSTWAGADPNVSDYSPFHGVDDRNGVGENVGHENQVASATDDDTMRTCSRDDFGGDLLA